MVFRIIKGGKADEPEKVEKPAEQKPRAWQNMYDILTKIDLVAEYKLVKAKKSRLPKLVRDAVVGVVDEAIKKGVLTLEDEDAAQ